MKHSCRFPNPSVLERFSPSQAALWTLIPILNVEKSLQMPRREICSLFGVNLSEGNYQTMLNYLFPVLAFCTGNRTGRHGPYKRTEPASLETDFCPYRSPDPDCSQFLSYDAQSACQLAYLFLPVAFRLKVSAKFTDKGIANYVHR